jgi:endoglucanase
MLTSVVVAFSLLTPFTAPQDMAAANKALGRGINLGNALEGPTEGAWGVTLKADFFKQIKDAGFDSVRVPVRWSAHAGKDAPYTIDPKFFERVDWVLDQAAANRLHAVLNVHHYDELDKEPDRNVSRLAGLWKQIAARYKDRPATVYFELYNEPHDKLTEEKWNAAMPAVLAEVRKTNPTRPVVVGPGQWNGIRALPKLQLPDDPNLIVTVHYYSPFEFTHQGASWAGPKVAKLRDIPWNGTDKELAALRKDLDAAAKWGKEHKRPIYLGEFGAYEKADMASRARWTQAMVREAEARGFSWAYWEFCAGFGAFDQQKGQWREPLRKALTGK